MRKNKVDIITLGCSKNLVDSEQLMRQFVANGYTVEHDPHKINGEIVVVNTCGFIGDAKEESINMILEFAQAKEEGELEKLYVMGCLSERYLKELAIEIPQVDKDRKSEYSKTIADLNKQKNSLLEEYGKGNKVVGQLIDLALLANGLLKGEALNRFVKRSVELIK